MRLAAAPSLPVTGISEPMNEAEVIEICRQAIIVMLKLVGPIMLAGLITGIIVSMVQTVTQIQETALTFIPKMLVVFGITIWMLPFMLSTLDGFTHTLTDRIVQIGENNED
jgi:flagellar biosynthetic protein FliQ